MLGLLQTNRTNCRPTSVETLVNRVLRSAGFGSPLANVQRSISDRQKVFVGCLLAFTLILVLLALGSPSHIPWFVVPVVILSIQGMGRGWSLPYLFEELLERFETKLNSPSAVVLPSWCIRVGTSVLSLMKCHVLGGPVSAMLTAGFPSFDSVFTAKASTRSSRTTGKKCPPCDLHCSTIATASPSTVVHVLDNDQPSESLT